MKANELVTRLPLLGISSSRASSGNALETQKVSLVERTLTVTGTLVAPELEVIVEGMIKGVVTAHRILISETGRISGDLRANVVDVAGEVHGRIEAMGVALRSSARVNATIYHHKILIESGAIVKGLQPWRPEGYMKRRKTEW
ncbi:uncharacterized protein METZ01_LOCUS463457 [marine metagenome]|uniref:Polymer-forming cytoskeletal protein n=1 Tax=marine metagenome TaxID=408172 RepID=A0A383ASP5_9ZZZZ